MYSEIVRIVKNVDKNVVIIHTKKYIQTLPGLTSIIFVENYVFIENQDEIRYSGIDAILLTNKLKIM